MTMAEKIIALRKRECWSQEDLADRLDVSRQSVSKWEGGQAAPAIDKLLEMSRLFGVSTDYLLRDELESLEPSAPESVGPALREVTLDEAKAFAALKEASAKPIALAVALCILSPVALFLLGGLSELGRMNQYMAVGLGLAALFAFVVPAVALFVSWGMRLGKYEYLEKEIFTAAPGVEVLAGERMEKAAQSRGRRLATGICLCIAAAVPLFVAMGARELVVPLFVLGGVSLLLVLAAAGVYLIVSASIPWGAYQMLLQEGDYAPEKKAPWRHAVRDIYWCAVTAGYLAWSFVTQHWQETWVVWPIAGVAYGAIDAALRLARRRRPEK